MEKYEKFNRQAKMALADIFVCLEEKCIQFGRIDDVLVVRPDKEKNAIICGVGKQENMSLNPEFNNQLIEEVQPYFNLLKTKFTADVVYQFITKGWDKEIYIKSSSELITEKLIAKITAPDYIPNKPKI